MYYTILLPITYIYIYNTWRQVLSPLQMKRMFINTSYAFNWYKWYCIVFWWSQGTTIDNTRAVLLMWHWMCGFSILGTSNWLSAVLFWVITHPIFIDHGFLTPWRWNLCLQNCRLFLIDINDNILCFGGLMVRQLIIQG